MANNLNVTEGAGPKATRTVETSSNVHDQAVTQGGTTATLSNTSASATSVTLSSSATARRFWSVFNDSTATCYVKFGTTASTTSFTVRLDPYDFYQMPSNLYTGRVDAIWDSATGTARVTEVTV